MIHIFIINNKAGYKTYSEELRNHLREIKDIKIYQVHTRQLRDETNIVREMINLFEGEKIRIYSCGGSGTFRNIISGVDDFSNIEFAFYPKGITNDFLRVFGKDKDKFSDIDELIYGKARMIDYIKTDNGLALNTSSTGIDTVQVQKHRAYAPLELFGKRVSFYISLLYSLIFTHPAYYEIEYDGKIIKDRFMEIFYGNGGVLGGCMWFDRDVNYTDGLGKLMAFRYENFFAVFHMLACLMGKVDVDNDPSVTAAYAKNVTIRRCDGEGIPLDVDGERLPELKEWHLEMVKEGLPFVIPRDIVS